MSAPCEFGNWQYAIDTILEKIEGTHTYKSFVQLKSNEERVKFIFQEKLLVHVEWLPLYFTACKKWHGKSSEVAKVWKTKGNKLFQQKKYADAVSAYTESCLHAPVNQGDDLPVSYGNRSAALFHSGNFEDCVLDIDRAVSHRFPTNSLHKLLARKTSALIKLGQKQEAEKSYKVLADFIKSDAFSLQEKKKNDFLKDMSAMEKLIREMDDVSEVKREEIIPGVSFGANTVISQATDAVSFTYTSEKGRHLLARHHIPKGSTIIVERPFAAVLLPDHYETHCHHCFSPLPHTPIGCTQCTTVRFCNESCHAAAWASYHGLECPYMDLFHSIGIAHLSLRIILCAKLDFLTDFLEHQSSYRKSSEAQDQGISRAGLYDRSYLTVFDLMTHEENTQAADLLQYSMTAALLLVTLTSAGFFSHVRSKTESDTSAESLALQALGHKPKNGKMSQLPPEMFQIGGLLLRHILQLVCNAHAITSLQASSGVQGASENNTQDTEQVRIATAIYPTASLMNHSCDPTIISSFVGDVLVVRTVKDVDEGEEIYNCYGPHFCRMNREERQEILRSQYHFDCYCPSCNSGDVSHERFSAFKCPTCTGVLRDQLCLECGQTVDNDTLTSMKLMAEKARKLFEKAITLMSSQNVKGAINKLKECQKRRQDILYKDHKDLALGDDAIARCFAAIGDYSSSADHLYNSIQFAEQMYGDRSIEFAHELQKLAEVLFNAERFTECQKVASQCLALFESLYSPKHASVKEMKELVGATQLALAPMMKAS